MPRFSLVEDAPKDAHGEQTGNKLLREVPARPGGTRQQGRRRRLGGATTEAGFVDLVELRVPAQRDGVGSRGRRGRHAAGLEFSEPGLDR